MFYVKTQLNEDAVLTTEITAENVFTSCPRCDAEVDVDLAEMFHDGVTDLFRISVLCDDCARKLYPHMYREES